jgi:hypothetical protein
MRPETSFLHVAESGHFMKNKKLQIALMGGLVLVAIFTWARAIARYGIDWELNRSVIGTGGAAGLAHRGNATAPNGFDISNAIIPKNEILSGGPPRDGIPSIDSPKFIRPEQADYMRPEDIVISLTHGSETRAYPLRILVWHEIANDRIENLKVAVTYCPLCGTAMAFDRTVGGRELTFGVSGLLYQSDVLMYDRKTESLWSQLAMKAVAGPLVNTELKWLPSEHLTWEAWNRKFPDGKVLSTNTGHARDYTSSPYQGYESVEEIMFPVPQQRRELPNKEWVLGVVLDGEAKAYPVEQLPPNTRLEDELGGEKMTVSYDPSSRRPEVLDESGNAIPYVMVYWFAWQAFYPDTELWKE